MREFTTYRAVRANVPLLIALIGPSTSGKTFSAHRLAKGIQRVQPGPIHGIDTENRGTRMLELADQFEFQHVPFVPPFGSLDYLAAIQHCVNEGARTVIVDSMSHEHEGEGGCIEAHEIEIDRRMRSEKYRNLEPGTWQYDNQRDKLSQSAWITPKANRGKLIQGLLQLRVNVILCFRAKEKTKPDGGKIKELGWMPIGGDEFWFEMTARCLLPPGANGVPKWHSEHEGEKLAIRRPRQFEKVLRDGRQLTEEVGEEMAAWAVGGTKSAPPVQRTPMLAETCTFEQAIDVLEKASDVDSLRALANDLRAGTWDAEQRATIAKTIGARQKALKEGK